MPLPLRPHNLPITLPRSTTKIPLRMRLPRIRNALHALAISILLAAVMSANGQNPSIEADSSGIQFVVQDGQRVGYRMGGKNVTFPEEIPEDFRQYTNTMFMSMFSAFLNASSTANGGAPSSSPSPARAEDALGLPGMESMSFVDLTLAAAGSTVNFWMWNGGARYNTWVDSWLAPKMLSKYQIRVVRNPDPSGAPQAVDQLRSERVAGTSASAVDMIWINGNNFRNLKTEGLSYCGWANRLPSAKYYDWFSPSIAFDFGVPTSGCEMPYNTAQIVWFHNTQNLPNPPRTIPALIEWIRANPRRFQYSNPLIDHTGSAFIRSVFYHYAGAAVGGSWQDFLGGSEVNEALYTARAGLAMEALRNISSALQTPNNYPDSIVEVNVMYAQNRIYLNLAYDPAHAASNILSGTYPNSTDSYVMDDGTISNVNFIGIPDNAANKAAALVTANFIGSMEAVYTRALPEFIGALPSYNANSPSVVESGWNTPFDFVDKHASVPSVEELQRGRLSEISSNYKDRINSDWDFYVRRNRCGVNPESGVALIPC